MARNAAALIIGNEILSGKIREDNLAYLGRELFLLGIPLERVVVCTDEIDAIASQLNELRSQFDIVFTSGGVGPTHDDVTLEGIAAAFGTVLERSESIADLIRAHYKARTTEAHLRMANVPRGASLLSNPDMPWPTVAMDNVFIFPGVPEIFRYKFPVVRAHLAGDRPLFTRAVFTSFDEGDIAEHLAQLARRFADVSIGSYPAFRKAEYRTKITFDGREEARVVEAAAAFADESDAAGILRVE